MAAIDLKSALVESLASKLASTIDKYHDKLDSYEFNLSGVEFSADKDATGVKMSIENVSVKIKMKPDASS